MKTVSLSGSPRESVGKKDATNLRKEGRVPAVLYGGKDQTSFHVSEIDISKLIFTPNIYIIEIDIDGNKRKAIIKEIQQHPVTDKVIHVDFLEIFDDKLVRLNIPISLVGIPIGVRNGGRLARPYKTLTIEALPSALPDAIELDVAKVRIGQAIRVEDIKLEGVNILAEESAVVMAVKMARAAIEEEEEEEEGGASAEDGDGAKAEGGDKPAEGGDKPAE